MIRTDEVRSVAESLKKLLYEAGHSLDIESKEQELIQKQKMLEDESVWSNLQLSQKISKEVSDLQSVISAFKKAESALNDIEGIMFLAIEENDENLYNEANTELKNIKEEVESLHIRALLRGKYDNLNALLTLHAGAGGTEACDWVDILYRMYIMYAEKRGYKITELDRLDGDEAGIKNVSFKIEGANCYGYLKAEKGVHRLVRISPFDANKRRHTSFASLEVMPEIIDNSEIEIKPEELKIDTYRSGGAGGQHVNKTDSAVRITHIPTGIIVACQNERSQTQNKEMAMRMLMSKLIEKREAERLEQEQDLKGDIKKIEWGSQIRSYVFCPYTLVKDHRTGFENSNITEVMDGNIQPFITEYLKKSN